MSRDTGFAIADFSTSHHDDAKVKAMWRALRDEAAMNTALVLFDAVVLASWRDGKRVTAGEACPVWIADVDTPAKTLTDYGLLDETARIPRATWNLWFGVAKKRRNESRERWRRSKAAQRASTKVNGAADESPRGTNAETRAPSVRPVPTVRPSPRARARGTGQLTRVGEILPSDIANGLALLEERSR